MEPATLSAPLVVPPTPDALAAAVASWPKTDWHFVLVHPFLDPENSHPVAIAQYDEALDSVVVAGPDGLRAQTAFVREETTREYLWRRGWTDRTVAFVAARDGRREPAIRPTPSTAPEPSPQDLAVLAALREASLLAGRSVAPTVVGRTSPGSSLLPDVLRASLDRLVSLGLATRTGSGAVVLYLPTDAGLAADVSSAA